MPQTFQYHAGKGTRLFIGNSAIAAGGTGQVELDLIGLSMGASNEIQGFKTSKTGRLTYREITFADNSLSFTIERDFLAQVTGTNGANLSVLAVATIANGTTNNGTFSAAVYLNLPYPGTPIASTPAFIFSSLVIASSPDSIQVEGKEALSYTCPINGPWTEPT